MTLSSINRSGSSSNTFSEKKPDFFIVGAPKCGTTAFAHYLGVHPDIYMARKEMHFFGEDLHFGPQFFRRDKEAYPAEFNNWNGQTRTGEASVWYLFSCQAASEIKAFNPEARIIIMLREPVSMLYSLYHQFRFDGNEYLPSFEQALAAESDRKERHRVSRQTYFAQGLAYRSTACYTEQVRRYFKVFGRERVHVIIYDDFTADTAAVYQNTLNFLGVASDLTSLRFEAIGGNTSVKSPAFRTFLNDPLVRGTAIALRFCLPRFLFAALQNAGSRINDFNRCPAKRAPLAPEIQLSLRREFAPEVERLSLLLGRDLTYWSKSGSSAAGDFPASVSNRQADLSSFETVNHNRGNFDRK